MALATAFFGILLAATVCQLRVESKNKDIPLNEMWKIGGYLDDQILNTTSAPDVNNAAVATLNETGKSKGKVL